MASDSEQTISTSRLTKAFGSATGLFDIDLAVLTMRRKVANVVAKARPRGQQSVG